MFTAPMVAVSAISPNGQTLKILDADTVQQAMYNISNEFNHHENKINQLIGQFNELDAFTKYCAQHYPEVINEWVLTKMTREKLLGKKKETI